MKTINLNLLNSQEDDKYIRCFEEADPTIPEEIFEVLSSMNAFLLTKAKDKKFEEQNKRALLAFYRWFMGIYGQDETLMEKMCEQWFGRMPRVLAMGQTFHEELEYHLAQKNYYELNDQERRKVDIFHKHLAMIQENRDLNFYFADGTTFWIELPKSINKKDKDYLLTLTRGAIAKAIDQKGILVMALNPQTKCERISAFDFDHREIHPIPAEIVKQFAKDETSIDTHTAQFEEIEVFGNQKTVN